MIEMKVIWPQKGEFEKDAWDAIKGQMKGHYENLLKDVVCTVHHQRPKVIISGTLQNPDFKIEGCCQKLIDEVTEALK